MAEEDGSFLSGLSDMVESGLQAGADIVSGHLYTAQAGTEAAIGAASHVAGGVADALGADETAQSMHDFGDHQQNEASASLSEAGRQYEHAWDELTDGASLPDLPDLPPLGFGQEMQTSPGEYDGGSGYEGGGGESGGGGSTDDWGSTEDYASTEDYGAYDGSEY